MPEHQVATNYSVGSSATADGPASESALGRMLHPRAIALVGTSGRPESLNARPLRYLIEHGYRGAIYPINPNYDELQGVRCYPDLASIPGPVDLVLVLVPAKVTPEIVRQAGEIGAAGAIIYGSGFAETGPEGSALQEELSRAARDSGVRVLGPNCQGLIYAPTGTTATFTAAADRPLGGTGGVAYVGQSGAVGGSVLDLATEMGLGLTAWVSTGNQVDLDLVEMAEALLEDDAIRVIMLYAEMIADGDSYSRLARRSQELGKHLIVLLSGRSEAGRRAAASHTGSMLGDDAAFLLTSRRYGVTLVDDVDELLAVAATIGHVSGMHGRRVGVITTSGGAGSLTADHCEAHDLALPELSAHSQERLQPLVPDFGAVTNPVDVTAQLFNREGSAEALGEVCAIVAEDPEIDLVAVVLTMVTGQLGGQIAQELAATADRLDKPLLVSWLAGQDQTAEGRSAFRARGFPVFKSVGDLARTAGLLAPVAQTSSPGSSVDPSDQASSASSRALDACLQGGGAAEQLLDSLGISQPRAHLLRSRDELDRLGDTLKEPFAMKIQATSLAHKSDLGGVELDVPLSRAVEVYDQLVAVAETHRLEGLEGVLVQEMIPPGVELIIGATSSDDGYPPVVTVGMGGVATEIFKDVVSDLAPISLPQAEAMLRQLKGWPLLDGFRGAPRADIQAAAQAVAAVSRAVSGLSGRAFEFEINPLIVAGEGHGAFAVDVLVQGPPTGS